MSHVLIQLTRILLKFVGKIGISASCFNRDIFNDMIREKQLLKKKTTCNTLQNNDHPLQNCFLVIDFEKYGLFVEGVCNCAINNNNECWLFEEDNGNPFGVQLATETNHQFFYERKVWMVCNTKQENMTPYEVIYTISCKNVGL